MATLQTSYFSPSDDDDDNRKLRSIEALARAANGGGMAPAPMPDSRSFAMGSPDVEETESTIPDPVTSAMHAPSRVESFAGGQEMPSPKDDEDDGAPGVSPWAVVADLLLNHGRGLGGVIGQAQQQAQDYRKQKRLDKRAGMEDAAHAQQLQLGMRNADLRQREIENEATGAQRRYDALMNPDSIPLSKAEQFERERFKATQESSAASLAQQHELALADDRRADAAMLSAENDRRAQRGISAMNAHETSRYHDMLAQEHSEARAAAAEAKIAAGDERKAKSDQDYITTFATKTEGARKGLKTIGEIDSITGRYKNDPDGVPGLDATLALPETANDALGALSRGFKKMRGTYDDKAAGRDRDADTLRKLTTELGEATLRDETGAAANLNEVQKNKIRHAMGASASQDQRLEALRIAKEAQQSVVQGFAAANPSAARRSLASSGIDASFVRDAGAPTQAAGGEVTIVAPDGSTRSFPQGDPRIEKYVAKGGRIQ